jgi:hypothetical protein
MFFNYNIENIPIDDKNNFFFNKDESIIKINLNDKKLLSPEFYEYLFFDKNSNCCIFQNFIKQYDNSCNTFLFEINMN